jgi:hypothetical protein
MALTDGMSFRNFRCLGCQVMKIGARIAAIAAHGEQDIAGAWHDR